MKQIALSLLIKKLQTNFSGDKRITLYLGGAYCGAAFTEATNVGPGQFMIKAFDGFTEGKIALVVAGYEAADTVNAATYLRTQDVDTSSAYIGTSSTAAELIVA